MKAQLPKEGFFQMLTPLGFHRERIRSVYSLYFRSSHHLHSKNQYSWSYIHIKEIVPCERTPRKALFQW